MAFTLTREQAYAQGRAAGQAVQSQFPDRLQTGIRWAQAQYPATAGLDFEKAVCDYDQLRLSADIDTTRFPECRGLRELVDAERQGFRDATQNNRVWEAFHYSWYWFCSRRLNTRYVGREPLPAQCTDFWIANTREGGAIHGCNRDDVRENYTTPFPPPTGTVKEMTVSRIQCVGGVSSAVLCDEEPEDLFPLNLDWIDQRDITTLPEFFRFMERYRDFWGPGNRIYVDPQMNFAAVEKANRRMGVRYADQGHCAITACAYLTPEMNRFKKERGELSLQIRGWTHDCPDWIYWEGCEKRYRRLLQLVEAEAKRGATLLGCAEICLDHAVPLPDRICLAGERCHPDEVLTNWTLNTFVRVANGPHRRCLVWNIDPRRTDPIYTYQPVYLPGDNQPLRPEWIRDLQAAGEIGLHPVPVA